MISRIIQKNFYAFGPYLELAKPRIVALVLVSTAIGFYLAGQGVTSWELLALTLTGTGLTAGGAGALNHYLERHVDALMHRTRSRPLPRGLIQPGEALGYGLLLVLGGVSLLAWQVNLLTGFLALLTTFLYVLVYTPMKRISWLNTSIGAIPGALPILGGWTAASGSLNLEAGTLFAVMFLWQHPHFYAIAWMFHQEYEATGFKMLPPLEPLGKWTAWQIIGFLVVLIPASVLPTLTGLSGSFYLIGTVLLGLIFILAALPFLYNTTRQNARTILLASVIYLPLWLGLIVADTLLT